MLPVGLGRSGAAGDHVETTGLCAWKVGLRGIGACIMSDPCGDCAPGFADASRIGRPSGPYADPEAGAADASAVPPLESERWRTTIFVRVGVIGRSTVAGLRQHQP